MMSDTINVLNSKAALEFLHLRLRKLFILRVFLTHASVRRTFHLSETGFIKQLLHRSRYAGLNLQPLFFFFFLFLTQQKRKLRIYISNTYTPSKPEGEESEKVSSWELRVEGKLLEEVSGRRSWGTGPFVSVWTFARCLLIPRCCVPASCSWSLAQTA